MLNRRKPTTAGVPETGNSATAVPAVPASELPEALIARMRRYKCGSGTFRMNVALSELPDFTCHPGTKQQDHHASGIVIGGRPVRPMDIDLRWVGGEYGKRLYPYQPRGNQAARPAGEAEDEFQDAIKKSVQREKQNAKKPKQRLNP